MASCASLSEIGIIDKYTFFIQPLFTPTLATVIKHFTCIPQSHFRSGLWSDYYSFLLLPKAELKKKNNIVLHFSVLSNGQWRMLALKRAFCSFNYCPKEPKDLYLCPSDWVPFTQSQKKWPQLPFLTFLCRHFSSNMGFNLSSSSSSPNVMSKLSWYNRSFNSALALRI